MKTCLMYPDRDFDTASVRAGLAERFAQDIELDVLIAAAAGSDRLIRTVMAAVCAEAWTNDSTTVRYRQGILKDCLANPELVRRLYAMAGEPFGRERSWDFSLYGHEPSAMVGSAVRTLQHAFALLRRLRDTCLAHADRFASTGLQQLLVMLRRDLDDTYLAAVADDLNSLTFGAGVLLSAHVGGGGKAAGLVLRKPQPRDMSWMQYLPAIGVKSYTLQLQPRDDAGAQAFSELQNRGLGQISDAIYRSAEHVLGFLKALRDELAFYVGCLNLKDRLDGIGESTCFPEVSDAPRYFRCRDLRDTCLSLTLGCRAVGNDVDAGDRPLVIITGANRGGKSTFLRSVGVAQLMLQCGLFVTAEQFSSSLRSGLFTHYKRQEDRSMRSGKFDEELVRMSEIADHIRPGALVLFNESFAATHEREGAEIARQVVSALLDSGVTVFFVTHMYELARVFFDDDRVLFLRADPDPGGTRTFRLHPARPLPRSFGIDLYRQIFGPEEEAHDQPARLSG
ncbi:MutS-related protein [Rhodopila sp.]|uniref:MutS-related protein n=1 Tax=Rhodopila sp. TaxID=2480087 RepID=UPI002CBF99FF|nr:DNA mismatch repair protein MutS [Rhodopila sp.]HVZ06901.1 DNA mismatch repair protein MutS [Rhodopila sp.]